MIYILHEKFYPYKEIVENTPIDSYSVYVYKNYDNVINRIIDETGKTREDIITDLNSSRHCVISGNFVYEIEESELQ